MDTEPFGLEFPKARAALVYAERRHQGQLRKCGGPFILHPLEVAELLRDAGASDELVAAGLLHDVTEKTATAPADVRRRFGARVAKLVDVVSEDPAIASYRARKAALREQVAVACEDALKLFAADKLSKVNELLRYEVEAPARRIEHYRRSVELLQTLLPGYALTDRLAADFARLESRLPVGSGGGN
jgi:(p)ppGpp synthase/HD superfamily hydrolase